MSNNIELQPFDTIVLDNAFEVSLEESNTYEAEVVAVEGNLKYIELTVTNNTLYVKNTKTRKWMSPDENKVRINIKSKPFSKLNVGEACNVYTLNPITSDDFGLNLFGKTNDANLELNCNTFYYWNNFPCAGRLTLRGNVNQMRIWNYALMSVYAENLLATNAYVENNAKGDCRITVTEQLVYSIKWSGNIHLYNTPQYIEADEISSTGKLIQH